MLVLQQVNVISCGEHIEIMDEDKTIISFRKSAVDGSLLFENAHDADRYNKSLSAFRVFRLFVNIDPVTMLKTYYIQIREGYDNENKGAAKYRT